LSFVLRRETFEQKRLSKAALETLAIVAYHQPVTAPTSRKSAASSFPRARLISSWKSAG